MRKIAVILFLSYYSLGTMLCPRGDISYLPHLSEIYDQCAKEDPDINIVDFVFEHMLNLGFLIEHFEGAGELEEHEKPHQPFQLAHSSAQFEITLNKMIHFDVVQEPILKFEKRTYPLFKDIYVPSGYLSEVFHPPLA